LSRAEGRDAVAAPGPEALLAAQFTHDIRSPLAAIVALTGSLAEELDGVASEHQLRQLQLIYNASLGLNSLVSDVLDLVRPAAADGNTDLVDFSLEEVLRVVRDLLQPAAHLSGAVIELRTAKGDLRRGWPARLRRVLFNLSSLPLRGGYAGVVEIGAEALEGDAVRFSIRSSEAHLSPAVIETVRNVAFGRLPRDRTNFSTFGLELSFRLVDSMGSVLEAETDPDGGTAFSFVVDLPAGADRHPGP
jgi:signal transduction histidine kinase